MSSMLQDEKRKGSMKEFDWDTVMTKVGEGLVVLFAIIGFIKVIVPIINV